MATTPNQKPVPSEDYANMRFNAGKFDEFITSSASSYVDRLGVTHLTVTGIQASVAGALLPANNLSDVQNAATSRANLGATTIGSNVFTATTTANARTAILAAVRGANSDITGLTGIVTAPLIADANAINYSGWSYITSGSSTNYPAPLSGAASMFTNQLTSTVSSQLAHAVTANTLYTRGQTAVNTYTPWIPLAKGGVNADITSLTGLTTPLSVAQGGTGNTTGLAATATALATARTFTTNLASPSGVSFNGTANATLGVTGTLPIANGGTGATTAAAALTSLGAKANAGVTDASSAAAGVVGELLSVTTTATANATSTAVNAAQITLTAGDWDVDGVIRFNPTTAPYTAIVAGVNTGSATQPSFPAATQYNVPTSATIQQTPVPTVRINVSAPTTIYLVGLAIFATGTSTVDGFIRARRIR